MVEMKPRVILVGRHAPIGLEEQVEIIEQRNIQFPSNVNSTLLRSCVDVLKELVSDAQEERAAVLFQAVPGQLAIAIAFMTAKVAVDHPGEILYRYLPLGVVISRPAPREAAVSQTFQGGKEMYEAVHFANPNAWVDYIDRLVYVTVDPPMKFEFDHIEWL